VFGRLLDRIGFPILIFAFFLSKLFAPFVFLGGASLALVGMMLWGLGMGAQDSLLKAVLTSVVPAAKRSTAIWSFRYRLWHRVVSWQCDVGFPIRSVNRYCESVFDFFAKLSMNTLGYEVKHTLLLHANDLNADHFDDLVRMMKRRGYRFISLEDALKDKAYRLPDAQEMKGLSWIHRWRLAKGLPLQIEPTEPEFITQLFRARQGW